MSRPTPKQIKSQLIEIMRLVGALYPMEWQREAQRSSKRPNPIAVVVEPGAEAQVWPLVRHEGQSGHEQVAWAADLDDLGTAVTRLRDLLSGMVTYQSRNMHLHFEIHLPKKGHFQILLDIDRLGLTSQKSVAEITREISLIDNLLALSPLSEPIQDWLVDWKGLQRRRDAFTKISARSAAEAAWKVLVFRFTDLLDGPFDADYVDQLFMIEPFEFEGGVSSNTLRMDLREFLNTALANRKAT